LNINKKINLYEVSGMKYNNFMRPSNIFIESNTCSYKSFFEWLAGVIDGAGVFWMNTTDNKGLNNIVLDIELLRPHYRVLTAIWLKYGGSIKQVSLIDKKKILNNYRLNKNENTNNKLAIILKENYIKHLIVDPVNYDTGVVVHDELFKYHIWRYRLKDSDNIEDLIINIYSLVQRNIIKLKLEEFKNSIKSLDKVSYNYSDIDLNSEWFAGIFDACGLIDCNEDNLIISLNNICFELLKKIHKAFGLIGNIKLTNTYNRHGLVEDRGSWYIIKKDDILKFTTYFENHEARSDIGYRIKLINKYYNLIENRNYDLEEWEEKWELFMKEWNKYRI
jgi:hypothetical protein